MDQSPLSKMDHVLSEIRINVGVTSALAIDGVRHLVVNGNCTTGVYLDVLQLIQVIQESPLKVVFEPGHKAVQCYLLCDRVTVEIYGHRLVQV